MALNPNTSTPPTDASRPLLIGISLSTLLYGTVLGLSTQYLSAMSRINKLAPEPYLATRSSRPGFVAILSARLERQMPTFLLGEYAFRNFTVLVTHMAGLCQTIIRFYILWQLAIVQRHLDLSLNPLVIPFGLAISTSLLTVMIQTIVQISLLRRAQKLDRIAAYSATLATERDQNRAISLSSDTHSIRVAPGEEEDNEWLVALRHRRLITHSLYLQQGSSAWRWKALQCLIGICTATGVASAVLNTVEPFAKHQGIALTNTSGLVNQKVGTVILITPIWYMLSAIVDVLISASTIRNLGVIRNQVLNIRNNRNDYVPSLRSLAVVMVASGVLLSGVQIISTILYFSLREKGWQYVPISILPRFYEITLVAVFSTSLKSQESRNCNRRTSDPYPLKSSSVRRLRKSPCRKYSSGPRSPQSLPAAMIREHSNLSLTYDSSDTHLDCENVLSIHYNGTSHTNPPHLHATSQSPQPSSISRSTFEASGQDLSRLSPNSQISRFDASSVASKSEYPLQSRFSDWGTATPETGTFRSRSTMS